MYSDEVKLGKKVREYASERSRLTVTFVLTQDCNLACGYCYMSGKNRSSKMTWEVAKQAVDFVLSTGFMEETVVFDFVGGEPLLEIDLMDQICGYIKLQLYLKDHKWKYDYMFSLSSNGVLYGTPRVQAFINEHHNHLSIGLSIDGTQEKHDMFRRFKDGTGSYQIVAENVKLWLEQFPQATTKVTCASDDLSLLKDSIVHLWEMGLKSIPANVVFEDLWKPGDDLLFEQQVRALADYALAHDLESTHLCHLLSDHCGRPHNADTLTRNWCGSGSAMIAIDHTGKIYPCIRFMGYSLNHKEPIVLGDIYTGINTDRMRPFKALDLVSQSPPECIECDVPTECAWCQGYNYDMADNPTIYQRATSICQMHKARVRANDYYFTKLARKQKKMPMNRHGKTLFFVLSDDAVPVCGYPAPPAGGNRMTKEAFQLGLDYAAHNFFFSVLMQPKHGPIYELPDGYLGVSVLPAERTDEMEPDVIVYENDVRRVKEAPMAVLIVDRKNIRQLSEFAREVLPSTPRTVLLVRDSHDFTEEDFAAYGEQLSFVGNELERLTRAGRLKEFSVLTDRLFLQAMDNCQAGTKTFALCPNGLFYICPAFYFANLAASVGNLEAGIDTSRLGLCDLKRAPICGACDAYHCKRCIFDNERFTGELNTPPHSQCVLSHVELQQSAQLLERIQPLMGKKLAPSFAVDRFDPFESLFANRYSNRISVKEV